MAQNMNPIANTQAVSEPTRYFRVQIRAWTRFDPSRMDLAEIAAEVDRGTAFLTAIEVLKIADNVNAIEDQEVRKSFEDIMAAERILKNVADLPKSLRERLYTALSSEGTDGRGDIAA